MECVRCHVSMQHPDESAEFVTLVDYLAGRLSGVYMARELSMRAPPPNLGQVKPGTNIFDFLQHVSPSHAAQSTKQPVQQFKRGNVRHIYRTFFIFLNPMKDTNKVKADTEHDKGIWFRTCSTVSTKCYKPTDTTTSICDA